MFVCLPVTSSFLFLLHNYGRHKYTWAVISHHMHARFVLYCYTVFFVRHKFVCKNTYSSSLVMVMCFPACGYDRDTFRNVGKNSVGVGNRNRANHTLLHVSTPRAKRYSTRQSCCVNVVYQRTKTRVVVFACDSCTTQCGNKTVSCFWDICRMLSSKRYDWNFMRNIVFACKISVCCGAFMEY